MNRVTLDRITFSYLRVERLGDQAQFRVLEDIDVTYEVAIGRDVMSGESRLTEDERRQLMAVAAAIEQRIERDLRSVLHQRDDDA